MYKWKNAGGARSFICVVNFESIAILTTFNLHQYVTILNQFSHRLHGKTCRGHDKMKISVFLIQSCVLFFRLLSEMGNYYVESWTKLTLAALPMGWCTAAMRSTGVKPVAKCSRVWGASSLLTCSCTGGLPWVSTCSSAAPPEV